MRKYLQNNQANPQLDNNGLPYQEDITDNTSEGRLYQDQAKNDNKLTPKFSTELKKFKTYQKVLKTINFIETANENAEEEIVADTGAISFALPCQALYNRTIKNELKRLEVEIYNKKLLNLYDNPAQEMLQYEEELKKLKSKINQK